jgi:hypothetical protein
MSDQPLNLESPDDVATFHRELTRSGFWGEIIFKYEAGNLVLVRQTRNLKLPTSKANRYDRGEHGFRR